MVYWLKYFMFAERHAAAISLPQVTLIGVDSVDAERLKMVMELCQSKINFGEVKLLSHIKVDAPYWTSIEKITSKEAYSDFIIRRLPQYVTTEFALVVQYDGFILNPYAWSDDFLKYDYIGAPWWFTSGNNIGNGGFSLRSKKFMNAVANDTEVKNTHPEDYVFCNQRFHHLVNQGIKFAPHHIASSFSVEGRETVHEMWKGGFGFHGLNVTSISSWEYWLYSPPSLLSYFRDFKRNAYYTFYKAKGIAGIGFLGFRRLNYWIHTKSHLLPFFRKFKKKS